MITLARELIVQKVEFWGERVDWLGGGFTAVVDMLTRYQG